MNRYRIHKYHFISGILLAVCLSILYRGLPEEKENVFVVKAEEKDTAGKAFQKAFQQRPSSVSYNGITGQKQKEKEEKQQIEKGTAVTAPADQKIPLTDIYSEPGSTAVFKCYVPSAQAYEWEVYDLNTKAWKKAEDHIIVNAADETERMVSTLQVKADRNKNGFMVRCRIKQKEEETVTETATLHVFEQMITNLSLEPANETEAAGNSYISTAEIPLTVTFKDGTEETIKGLNQLYFIDKEEKKNYDKGIYGNRIETITTTTTEHETYYLGMEKAEINLRYKKINLSGTITGKDLKEPDITEVEISPFKVQNTDQPVTVTVSIAAEDKETPYPELLYAFLPEGKEPTEKDWIQKNKFDVDITANGVWTAYCKDKAENYAISHINIIAVDQKPPLLTVHLAEETWCRSTRILASAEDAGKISYRYSCTNEGIDSGWVEEKEYPVKQNGSWQIQAKDEAGNISLQTLEVTNIDHQAPVIIKITEERKN